MRNTYNILFPAFLALSSPYYLLRMWRRGNWRDGFAQRFGRYEDVVGRSVTDRDVFWLHAVSVGEINVCVELVRVLKSLRPTIKFAVSTTTTTGMGELQKKLPEDITKIYYPIDLRKSVHRALDTIRPRAIILIEAEIWPNFIWRAVELGIPLFLVNARLSDRSYPRYRKFAQLFKQLFGAFAAVGAQTEEYASKLREVGCKPENVLVSGNLKFDTAKLNSDSSINVPALLAQLGVGAGVEQLVAGSTHEGEEKLLAQQFLRLRRRFPNLFLVLVPRHFERACDVGRTLAKCGLRFFYRSEITPHTRLKPGSVDCLIVDTTGELMNFYQYASVAFVGKSLKAKGGQNPIEPAALGRATVFGPNMQNFADVARIFVSQRGAIQVRDPGELERTLAELLGNPKHRDDLGRTAERIVRENQGAVRRTASMILQRCP